MSLYQRLRPLYHRSPQERIQVMQTELAAPGMNRLSTSANGQQSWRLLLYAAGYVYFSTVRR